SSGPPCPPPSICKPPGARATPRRLQTGKFRTDCSRSSTQCFGQAKACMTLASLYALTLSRTATVSPPGNIAYIFNDNGTSGLIPPHQRDEHAGPFHWRHEEDRRAPLCPVGGTQARWRLRTASVR